jgi:DNA/RNA-binding domain of Phe-tRNA-synthetase-like protein
MRDFSGEFTFSIADEVIERFPSYVAGCVLATGIDNSGTHPAIDARLADAEEIARRQYAGLDLKAIAGVAAWREAFAAAGWTPSKYPSSLEALLRRVIRGDALPRINPIVDLVNAVVLTHGVPIGAHDVEAMPEPHLTVRCGRDGDTFAPMGDQAMEAPDPGEILYASGSSVRTRRWVWRQSRDALVTSESRALFFPADGFRPATEPAVRAAVEDLRASLEAEFGASVTTGMVSATELEFRVGS